MLKHKILESTVIIKTERGEITIEKSDVFHNRLIRFSCASIKTLKLKNSHDSRISSTISYLNKRGARIIIHFVSSVFKFNGYDPTLYSHNGEIKSRMT